MARTNVLSHQMNSISFFIRFSFDSKFLGTIPYALYHSTLYIIRLQISSLHYLSNGKLLKIIEASERKMNDK